MATPKSALSPKTKRIVHPNSLANLKPPWPKGHNGNPDPGGFNVTRRLKRLLGEDSDFIPPDANPSDKKYGDQIARQMIIKSCKGDVPMIKELLDRTEGKVQEPDKPQYNDNRQYNIIIQGDDNKQKLEQLLSGERPKLIEATQRRAT